jgi:hypothetical protein
VQAPLSPRTRPLVDLRRVENDTVDLARNCILPGARPSRARSKVFVGLRVLQIMR